MYLSAFFYKVFPNTHPKPNPKVLESYSNIVFPNINPKPNPKVLEHLFLQRSLPRIKLKVLECISNLG